MIVRSKSPFRISVGGGGTDLPPYCTEHGGCIVSFTIDRHVYITLKPRSDEKIRIFSTDFKKEAIFNVGDDNYDEGFEIFKGVVNVLDIKQGFDIISSSDLPAGSGMGGSSSLTVALIGAYNDYFSLGLTTHEIAQKAYYIEREELGQTGGYQDQFAAAYGGFNYMEFKEDIKVFPLTISEEMINELMFRFVLCFVGGSHFSSDIQDEVLMSYSNKIEKKTFLESMQDLKNVANEMRMIFESNDVSRLDEFGKLLHQGWLVKKSLSTKISNPNVEKFYLASLEHGVIGGKLLGAGGGGHLILFCEADKKHEIIEEMEKMGGKIVNFHYSPKGLETWRIK
jgi:D-glycero-alpha-D-manno-heptose-7-phosphate kinase